MLAGMMVRKHIDGSTCDGGRGDAGDHWSHCFFHQIVSFVNDTGMIMRRGFLLSKAFPSMSAFLAEMETRTVLETLCQKNAPFQTGIISRCAGSTAPQGGDKRKNLSAVFFIVSRPFQFSRESLFQSWKDLVFEAAVKFLTIKKINFCGKC